MSTWDPTLPMGASGAAPGQVGLTDEQAARVLAARGGPPEPPESSRSVASIVRANTLTLFNLILAGFGVVTLAMGDWRDAVFLAILVGNSGIGILQELRSKRSLDRLAALVTPHARVVRGGVERTVGVGHVVPGDLLLVSPGEQVIADGTVHRSEGLAVDESVLTGESLPVSRGPGEELRAGSFCSEGSGSYVATAVGADSYAQRVAGEAREFRHPLSPLQLQVNKLLLALVALMIPLGIAFAVVLVRKDHGVRESVSSATAGVVSLVPEGLILLVSLAYAISALRMSRRGALAQQLSAIESLSSVDVLCLDKTGTLTEDALRVVELVPAPGFQRDQVAYTAAVYGRASSERDTLLEALGAITDAPATVPDAVVPFSSRWMWSSMTLAGRPFVLGAPEVVLAAARPGHDLDAAVEAHQAAGRRVLALAEAGSPPRTPDPAHPAPPADLQALGLVVLAEQMRDGVPDAIAFLRREGVRPVVISGDDPVTVAAIARDAGVPVEGEPLDGRRLPQDAVQLRAAVLAAGVVGRTPPEGKKRIVEALSDGRDVAMMGDGVNDVPALKAARVAVSPGNAADMARTIADIVLVRGGFESIPPMIREGRMVLRNLQRVAKLFVAKSILAAFLILTIGLSPEAYPFLPRHLTLASALTVGIPAFILALAPSEGPWRSRHFIRDVTRFAVPAGVATGLGVVASFLIAKNVLASDLTEARTVATMALVMIGLYLVLLLEGSGSTRRTNWTLALVGALMLLFVVVLSLASWRAFFDLRITGVQTVVAALVGTALAIAGMWATDARFAPPFPALRRLAQRI